MEENRMEEEENNNDDEKKPRISISVELRDRKVYVSASTEEKALEQFDKVMKRLDKREGRR